MPLLENPASISWSDIIPIAISKIAAEKKIRPGRNSSLASAMMVKKTMMSTIYPSAVIKVSKWLMHYCYSIGSFLCQSKLLLNSKPSNKLIDFHFY